MSDELIIATLKEYISPNDYDLHDWDTIINRRTLFKEGVYSYPCVYGNLLLTDDLEFYDAEPKQPIHDDLLMKMLSEEDELIISVLKKYVPLRYREDADLITILSRKEQVKEGVYLYKINNVSVCLDDGLELVEYGDLHIIDGNVYYDFHLDSDSEYDAYEWFGEL
mgnify:CR=1 FL=1